MQSMKIGYLNKYLMGHEYADTNFIQKKIIKINVDNLLLKFISI